MTSAADLFALQEIDLRRDARRALIADVEARLGETDELIEARESVGDAEAALDRLKKRQRDLDNELTDLDAKMRPLETRLYDGSVKNPKELAQIQEEVSHLKGRIRSLEDSALDAMLLVEEAENALSERATELDNVTKEWEQFQAGLLEERDKLTEQLKVPALPS